MPAYLLVGLQLSAPQLLVFLAVVAMLSLLGAALGILVNRTNRGMIIQAVQEGVWEELSV